MSTTPPDTLWICSYNVCKHTLLPSLPPSLAPSLPPSRPLLTRLAPGISCVPCDVWAGLYLGFWALLGSHVMGNLAFFTTYTTICNYYKDENAGSGHVSTSTAFLAGGIANQLYYLAGHPFDTLQSCKGNTAAYTHCFPHCRLHCRLHCCLHCCLWHHLLGLLSLFATVRAPYVDHTSLQFSSSRLFLGVMPLGLGSL